MMNSSHMTCFHIKAACAYPFLHISSTLGLARVIFLSLFFISEGELVPRKREIAHACQSSELVGNQYCFSFVSFHEHPTPALSLKKYYQHA